MSDREPEDGHSPRLLRALIWAGVGLAPVAALVVLVGGDGPERFAVMLVAVCVVLLGAALLIRSDPVLLRMHVEDRVAEEIGRLREELRGEFAAAGTAAAVPHLVPNLPPRTAPPQAASDPFTGAVRAASTTGRGGGRVAAGAVIQAGGVAGGRAGVPEQAVNGRAMVPGSGSAVEPELASDRGATPDRSGPRPHPGRPAGPEPHPSRRPASDSRAAVAVASVPAPGGRPAVTAASVPVDGGRAVVAAASVPAAGGRAAVAAASVPPTAAVPGQRAHSAGSVRPPVASAIPVFRPPAPASPAPSMTTGGTYATPRRGGAERTYGGRPPAEPTGRRRADETAVDIGYTGRRSRPNHAAEEPHNAGRADDEDGAGWSDDSAAGWSDGAGWRDGAPDAGWAEADPEPGYPGWAEADERHGPERRARNRTTGW